MSLRVQNSLNLSGLERRVREAIPDAEVDGAHVIFELAAAGVGTGEPRAANVAQNLVERASVSKVETGAEIRFPGPYADYLENDTHLAHPGGGYPKFLEVAMIDKKDEALQVAADALRKAIQA